MRQQPTPRPPIRHLPARRWLVPTLLVAALGQAYAQDASPPSALQTVTISATRRPELVRDVPLSMSELPAEQLEQSGARILNDFLLAVPGVVLQNSSPLDNAGFIIIRGLTTGVDARSPTTVYLDEVPLAAGAPFDINLVDLSRFEVLRGPQGTLYGSSAMGGIVKYVTRDPETDAFSGRALLGLSQTHAGGNNTDFNAAVNVPLKQDVAALRIAGFGEQTGGFVDATGAAGRKDVDRGHASGLRANLLLTPARGLSIKVNAMSQRTHADGISRVVYDLRTGQPVGGDLVYTQLGVAEPRQIQRDLVSATVEYDMQWARLLSITAWQRVADDNTVDLTPLGAAALGATSARTDSSVRNKQNSQEFRLVSQTPGSFDWLAGLFYADFSQSVRSDVSAVGGAIPGLLETDMAGRKYKETAAYGNVTWKASPALWLTGGVRAAHYDQTDTLGQDGVLVGGPQPPKTVNVQETPKTWLLAARYSLTPQSNLYARAANGYRPGGVNNNAVDPLTGKPIPGVRPSYGTDKAWTYEAGYKLSDAKSGTSLEATVFQTDWTDIQQATTISGVSFTSNLGKARIRGLELAGGVRPVPGLNLGLALTLLDPKLEQDSPGLGARAGDRLPDSPRTAASLTSRYDFSVAGQRSFVGLNVNHVGARNSGFENATAPLNYKLPAYTQVDLNGGLSFGRVDLNLYVRNLTDERGQTGASTGDASLGRIYVHTTVPRTLGLQLSAAF